MTTGVFEARGLTAGYLGRPVIHDLDITVGSGEFVCLLGPNGAGKTTTMLALVGELKPLAGEVLVNGVPETGPLHRRAKRGLAYVTEERSVFMGLSARDNLRCAGVSEKDIIELFPELRNVMDTRGGLLSGGEQQMLTLGRAILRRPATLLADELSLGLAPLTAERLLQAVRTAATERGTAVLVVEQHVRRVLRYADRVYVMRRGRIEMSLTAAEALSQLAEIEQSYLSQTPDPQLRERQLWTSAPSPAPFRSPSGPAACTRRRPTCTVASRTASWSTRPIPAGWRNSCLPGCRVPTTLLSASHGPGGYLSPPSGRTTRHT
jgi:branched-chain amino acid transport system ATP-binding protein